MHLITALLPHLKGKKNIVITTHLRPDGDAMGSSLGLYHYLLLKGHSVHVIVPTEYPYFLHWMPGVENVLIFSEQEALCKTLTKQADLIFCVDFNRLERLDQFKDPVAQSKAIKVMIDHHLDPEGFDQYRLWNTKACAASELVWDFIELSGDKRLLNQNIATCLYTGMMTDSGSFSFHSTTAAVHRKVANLIEAGADVASIHESVYESHTENKIRFMGYCLQKKMELLPEYRTAIIPVTADEQEIFQLINGDTEGIVRYALSITNILFAAIIIDRGHIIKLSLRSKGNFPANEVAERYFSGGGHRNAAGGRSLLSLDETVSLFKKILPEFKNVLNR